MNEENITTTGVIQSSDNNETIEVHCPHSTDFVVQATGGVGTLKIRGTMSDNVDLGEDASAENPWVYINLADSATGMAHAGATGIAVNDETKIFELNVNAIKKFAIELDLTSGSFNVDASALDNR